MMKKCHIKSYLVVLTTGLLVATLTSSAHSRGRFHARSENLSPTLSTGCTGVSGSDKVPGADYIPGQDRSVVPADVASGQSETYPVVGFYIGFGNRRKKSNGPAQLRNSRLRAGNLIVGEVDIDTATGAVTLDGHVLGQSKENTGC